MWKELANLYDLKISTWGIDALCGFSFDSKNALEYKTLITQEMLKKGYLAANSVYICTEHNEDVLEGYEIALDKVFELIAECENSKSIKKYLEGPICNSSFKRLI